EGLECLLQIEAAQSGHADIQHDATGGVLVMAPVKKLTRRSEGFHRVTGRCHQSREGFADGSIVVHHKHSPIQFCPGHSSSYTLNPDSTGINPKTRCFGAAQTLVDKPESLREGTACGAIRDGIRMPIFIRSARLTRTVTSQR